MALRAREFRKWLASRFPSDSNNHHTTTNQNVGSAVAQSPFYRLPLEVRQHILRLAFGDRILHLGFLYPSDRDANERTWWGCVCDRGVDWRVTEDMCSLVYRGHIRKPGPCLPAEIGVMGWLYSCRLGYVGVAHILYSTNTFHSASGRVVGCLDVLFPSHRLAQIPGLEISYSFDVFSSNNDGLAERESGIRQLVIFLSKIANFFHSLRNLHLSLRFSTCIESSSQPRQPKSDIVDNCLDRVDEIICQNIQGVKVKIVIDSESFFALRNGPGYAHCDYLQIGQFRNLWRKRKDRDAGILVSGDW